MDTQGNLELLNPTRPSLLLPDYITKGNPELLKKRKLENENENESTKNSEIPVEKKKKKSKKSYLDDL